jgi:hypothetical protein
MDAWGWEQLSPWLAARVELPVGPMFCIIDGPTRGRPWSGASVRTEFRRLAARAGVRRRFAPHQLRHAHALELARERVPLNIIQRQLGHANLGTTSIYLQGIDPEEIIMAVRTRRAPMMSASRAAALIESDGHDERERDGAPARPWQKQAPRRRSPTRSRPSTAGADGYPARSVAFTRLRKRTHVAVVQNECGRVCARARPAGATKISAPDPAPPGSSAHER